MNLPKLNWIGWIGGLAFPFVLQGQSLPSPLSSGAWAKFSVTTDGLYKIDFNQLQAAGFNPGNIDPGKIRLFGNGNGMLPQANSADRTNRLQEIALKVVGGSDGVFNPQDYILFFGQGPDQHYYDQQKEIFFYENNLYDDKNYYFLTVSGQEGKRVTTAENLAGQHPLINTYNDFIYHESESHNELKSGRQWFGERFDFTTERSLKFFLPGIVENSTIKVVSQVMAQTFEPASFNLSLNNILIKEQPLATIPNTQYGIKGRLATDTVLINAANVSAAANAEQTFNYQYNKGTSGKSVGFLDFLLASFIRRLEVYGNQTIFRAAQSLASTTGTFEVGAFPSDGVIWEVTDPFDCKIQAFQSSAGKASFSTETSQLKTFIATNTFPPAQWEETVANQDLHGNAPAELLIVAHSGFFSAASRLAAHRQQKNGITTRVVTTKEIYNDFSGGKQDPTAIRDFARSLYPGLKNILLFGRASYDFKDRVNKNTNLVPTYESRNSLSPLDTYSSDDYFAFFEPTEGEWTESISVSHTLDAGVGRLPVKTKEEADIVVDKLIAYDNNPKAFGDWRKEILFVADDGDFNLHQRDADKLATDVESDHSYFNTQKIYVDAFEQITRPSGQTSPEARTALGKTLKKGALIVNFTGHGSERVWLAEQIMDEEVIEEWKNDIVYPFLVTATCEFGRHDDPAQISSSELAITKSNGGTIGLVTATRPVSSSTNAFLNKSFYEALFKKENGKFRDMGTIFKNTKNKSVTGVSNRNFAFLGDPSMHLAMAPGEIVTSSITTEAGSDTLKALSKVIIKGEIHDGGEKDTGFNGTLTATLKDREVVLETLGDENPVFQFRDRINSLFRGDASVVNGAFELTFIVPKNIAPEIGLGKLSLYAKEENLQRDAIGGQVNFKIGSSEADDGSDKAPPLIRVFIGDTTFINGGIASSNTQLIALFSDKSGINISNFDFGQGVAAMLDDAQTFDVSEYYIASKDDFTRGMLVFPLESLSPGKHRIQLVARDVFNNTATAAVDFVVPQDQGLVIGKLLNYPNPFSNTTTIQFEHNRPGEDIVVSMAIVDITGQVVNTMNLEVFSSQFLVTLPEWDGTNSFGAKLNNGIYLLRLSVRSQVDGSKNEQLSKIIILN